MSRFPWSLCISLILVSCVSTVHARLPASDASFPVDFHALARFSNAYFTMRYGTETHAAETVGAAYDDFAVVDLHNPLHRYIIGTLLGARRQEVWIIGSENAESVLLDLQTAMHRNQKLAVNLHSGFESRALSICADMLPRLRKDFDIVLFGHSSGAAEAVILGMLLEVDGYRVAQIFASGQPRITDEEGRQKYEHLPILRIVNVGDPLAHFPALSDDSRGSYVHMGPALLLLDGSSYSLIGGDQGDASYGDELRLHFIAAYLPRIAPKLIAARQVPYSDRPTGSQVRAPGGGAGGTGARAQRRDARPARPRPTAS